MSLTQQPKNTTPLDPVAGLYADRASTARPASGRIAARGPRGLSLVTSLIAEARPPILGIFVLRIAVAGRLMNDPSPSRLVLTGAWLMMTMAVYVFNGTSDVPGDRLNGSQRPLATGKLSVRTAWIASSVLAAAALGLAWWCGDGPGLCASAALGLGWCYSAGPQLKRSAVGFAVTIFGGAALTYVAGCAQARSSWGVWVVLVVLAAWIGLCSGAKDLSDVPGDRAEGRRTWPVLLGTARAARLLSVFAVTAAAVTVGVAALYAPRLFPAAGVLLLGTGCYIMRLLRVEETDSTSCLRGPYRVFMLTQYAVNLAVLLCLL